MNKLSVQVVAMSGLWVAYRLQQSVFRSDIRASPNDSLAQHRHYPLLPQVVVGQDKNHILQDVTITRTLTLTLESQTAMHFWKTNAFKLYLAPTVSIKK